MSIRTSEVIAKITCLMQTMKPEELEALYNQLHDEDHIVYVGAGVFEHQDMDD